MATYILSIDAGTTSYGATIFDKNIKKIGIGQNEFTQYFPKNSWVWHDRNEIWSSQFAAIKISHN
jgi:glycerol kinase